MASRSLTTRVMRMTAAWESEAGQRALADVPNFLGRHDVVVITDHVIVEASSDD